jgi:hypothetical protein
MSTFKTLATTGIAAAALIGASLASTAPAEARMGGHGGFGGGHGGFGGAHFGGARFGGGGWGGGRHFGGGWGGRGWGGRGWGYGGIGLASGLAIGALAASSSYGYGGYGGYGYYPAYYGGGYSNAGWGGYEDECVLRPRRVWSPWGWRVSYVQVCY